jgi:predicted ribosome quality control (RQC) complex YloA/Tae2 family protein
MIQIKKYGDFINENLINSQLKEFSVSGHDIKYKKVLDELSPENSYDIYWGRNKESNHYLTSNFTGKHAKLIGGVGSSVQDIWLHASGYPGSHVLIKAIKDDIIPTHILKIGAEIAKKNSKAKDVDNADIVWCYKNYVSVNPTDDIQSKIKELESKEELSKEESDFIESNKPSIGRAFIDTKNRNIIRI